MTNYPPSTTEMYQILGLLREYRELLKASKLDSLYHSDMKLLEQFLD